MPDTRPVADRSLQRAGYSVRGLANWSLDYGDELGVLLTNMALNKLVYFAYERSVVRHGVVVTNAKIEAWDHGTVFREVYQAFKNFGDKPITSRASFFSVETGGLKESVAELTDEDAVFLQRELYQLIRLSASQLRELSHVAGGAWHRVWYYEGHANPGMEITPDLIMDVSHKGP